LPLEHWTSLCQHRGFQPRWEIVCITEILLQFEESVFRINLATIAVTRKETDGYRIMLLNKVDIHWLLFICLYSLTRYVLQNIK